jgi:arginyl-tRNA synthetase
LNRLFKTIELVGYSDLAKKLEHVNFGKVEGMSSRLGKVELLGDILDRCGDDMYNVMKENDDPKDTLDTLGINVVMV